MNVRPLLYNYMRSHAFAACIKLYVPQGSASCTPTPTVFTLPNPDTHTARALNCDVLRAREA